MHVSQAVGKAIEKAFNPERVGVMVAGLEVPHVHYHLIPIDAIADLDFKKQDPKADPKGMDEAAEKIRAALRDLGYSEAST